MKNACQMLMCLGIDNRCVYAEDFETPFLAQSAEFYRVNSVFFVRKLDENIEFHSLKAKNYWPKTAHPCTYAK